MNEDGIEMTRITIKEATALLREKTGIPYVLHPEKGDGNVATPLYKAVERDLLKTVAGIGGKQQYVLRSSFDEYLKNFEPRLCARRRMVSKPCPPGGQRHRKGE